jgi:site-specific recombinase XerD
MQHKKIKAFTRFVNDNIKTLALSVGVSGDISTYYARHSFATQAIRGNNSIEYVSEALGHSSIDVTQAYFAGFEDTTKKDIQESLVNFNE